MTFEQELCAQLPWLRIAARKFASSWANAEDLAQDACVQALAYKQSYKLGSNMRAWLYVLMRNVHFDQTRRKRSRVVLLPAQAPGFAGDPLETSLRHATSGGQFERVYASEVLTRLEHDSPWLKQAVICDVLGYTTEESAVAQGVVQGTVKSRGSRAKAIMEKFDAEQVA